jgi:hypothetical protein
MDSTPRHSTVKDIAMIWKNKKQAPNHNIDSYARVLHGQIAVFEDYHFHKYEATNN